MPLPQRSIARLTPVLRGGGWPTVATAPGSSLLSGNLSGNEPLSVLALDAVSPSEAGDRGGDELQISGTFDPTLPVTVDLVGPVGASGEFPCFSARRGQGYSPMPRSSELVVVSLPGALPVGTYTVRVAQGSFTRLLTDAIDIVAHGLTTKAFDLRRLFPPWYAVGARHEHQEGLQTHEPPSFSAIADQQGQVSAEFSLVPVLSAFSFVPVFSIVGGTLPSGLSINPATGEISGTPDALFTSSDPFKIRATYAMGVVDSEEFLFEVVAGDPFTDATMTLWLDFSDDSKITYSASPPVAVSITNKAADTTPVDDFDPVTGTTGFTVVAAAHNGLQAGRFNGSTNGLLADGWLSFDIVSNTSWRLFAVISVAGYHAAPAFPRDNDVIISENNGRWGLGISETGQLIAHSHDGSDDFTAGTPISLTTRHLVEFYRSGSVIGAVCDGVEVTTPSGTYSGSAQVRVGNSSGGTKRFNGDICEMIVYNVDPATDDAETTREYLRFKWDL